MGKQINFYMTSDDEAAFVAAAQKNSSLQVLPYRSSTSEFKPMNDLPAIGEFGAGMVWLWNPDISSLPESRWIEQQKHYLIDDSSSEVIQFQRSHSRDQQLFRGRLWAEMIGRRRDRPAETFKKSAEFQKWFESLVRWIKKNYELLDGSATEYVAPGAAIFRRQGGSLRQADFAAQVKIVKH